MRTILSLLFTFFVAYGCSNEKKEQPSSKDEKQIEEPINQKTEELARLTMAKDDLRLTFDALLTRLDSLTGHNNISPEISRPFEIPINEKKDEIRKILNNRNATEAQLQRCRQMLAELNDTIDLLAMATKNQQ